MEMRDCVEVAAALERWIQDEGYVEPSRSDADFVKKMGLDREDVDYFFNRVLGKEFRIWRKEYRISVAKKRLIEFPDLPVYIIGEDVGIPDKTNFRRQFLEVTGMTPRAYRDAFLKNID